MNEQGGLVPVRGPLLTSRTDELARRALAALGLPPGDKRVLWCDDEGGIIELGRLLLETSVKERVEISHELDGDAALARLAQERFDLLITDERHGGLSGTELCRASRKLHPSMPILMYTGCSEAELATRDVPKPWDAFLHKLLELREFVPLVRTLLRLPVDDR